MHFRIGIIRYTVWFFLTVFLFISDFLNAQPGPGGGPGGEDPPPVGGGPIDGGTFFLIILAMLYGVKKYVSHYKNRHK